MKDLRRYCLTLVLVTSSLAAGLAQSLPLTAPYKVDGVTYSEDVPSPLAFLGYKMGARHTRPDEIVDYFREIAAVSERVSLVKYGETYEGRPLIAAIVTSPNLQARLESIQADNRRLSEEPGAVTDDDLEAMPVIAEMHYTVHGNEASGSEAALVLLYHLAAGSGEPVESLLERAVVIIDPCINPDGRDRFVDWVNANRSRGGNPDPQDRELNEPWPNGRTNHYWFDLNRDWLPAQLRESQGRLELFHTWRPQVVLDGHEMGSDETFFFQPGVPQRTNPNTPSETFALTEKLSRYTARNLDRIGSLYFTREQYDDFYYGKGSTYPDVNGAVGILFEQGSSRGLVRSTADGELTYGFGIRNQLTASLGLLEGAVGLRTELLRHQRDFYRTAPAEAAKLDVGGWIFGSEEDRGQADALVQSLLRHRVQVYELARSTSAEGLTFSPGAAYVVPAAQPQFRLIKSSFERVTTFEDSVFYDVSAWTFPLAFGVQHAKLDADPAGLLGNRLTEHVGSGGHLIGGKSEYGYLLSWDRYNAPRVLYRMLTLGVPARVMLMPFELTIAGKRTRFERGTIVLPLHSRTQSGGLTADSLHKLVLDAVLNDHVVVHSVGRSLTLGSPDLGGPSSVPLHVPVVAALAGDGVESYRLGELRFVMNERMGLPLTLLDINRLEKVNLSAYSAIVMVDGDYAKVSPQFTEALRSWVSAGGRLIAIQRGATWAVEQGLTTAEFQTFEEPDSSRWIRFEDKDQVKHALEMPGAILNVQLDTSHPITFGLRQRIASFKTTREVLKPSLVPGATVGVYTKNPVLSGYVPRDRKGVFEGTAMMLAQANGEGRVVLMEDSPTFRGFWYGTQRLILNALLLAEAY